MWGAWSHEVGEGSFYRVTKVALGWDEGVEVKRGSLCLRDWESRRKSPSRTRRSCGHPGLPTHHPRRFSSG